MPATVLTDDDPCLDDLSGQRAECGTALLQRSNSHRSPQKVAPQAAARKASALSSSPSASAQVARPKESVRQAVATVLLADVRQFVSKVKQSRRSVTEMQRLAAEYAKLLETEAVPSINVGYEDHQKLLKEHVAGFARCDADLQGRMETGHKLRAMSSSWSRMHEGCRSEERRLSEEVNRCKQSLSELKDSTQEHDDQQAVCIEGEGFLETKKSECQSLLRTMHTANCARASQVSGICDMYDLCRAGMSLAYTSAKEAARAWESYHKAEWLAVVTVRCLVENLGQDSQDHPTLLQKLESCEQKVSNTTHLELQYEDPPLPVQCTAVSPSDSPCVEEIGAARISLEAQEAAQRNVVPSTAAAASAINEEISAEVVAGVSLMQEGIERATIALPQEMHQAFFGPMATPVTMTLALLTLLVLLIRCTAIYREKHAQQAAPIAAGPLAVDELIVPRNSKCMISVPRISWDKGALPWSALVTDKMGQPLFRANLAASADKAASDGTAETLTLTRQDGLVLVTCHLLLPKDKRRGKCNVLERSGGLFASMDWDDGQVTWFSWLAASKKQEPSAFVLKGASAKGWQLRILDAPGCNGLEGPLLMMLDSMRKSVAEVELCRSDSGGHSQESLRIEVCSEGNTDLGLITAAILAVDRLQTAAKA